MNEPISKKHIPVPEGIRLVEFYVEKLFGEFSYTIPLNLQGRVTAIVAPNGAGKTLCLRMIGALFGRKWSVFSGTEFARVRYRFSNRMTITIEPTPDQLPLLEEVSPPRKRVSFTLSVIDADGTELGTWKPSLADPRSAPPIERYLPFLTRTGANEWRHDHTGEAYNFEELMEAYGEAVPDAYKSRFYGKMPDELTAITDRIDCHLIETQRLLVLREDPPGPYYRKGGKPYSTLAISKKAEALKDIISKEIGNYATLSQSLDRSFPRRVIINPTTLSSERLKASLEELDQRRNELMNAGILDTEADDPVALPEGKMADAIARVLSVYVDDTGRKLSSLSNLLARIKLFKELIDQRFITKDVRITKKDGIEVTYKDRKVPIEGLSSGEQHQLVLFFELLFEIKKDSLILIDEPELSLHVAWQKKFIGDLMKIIELNQFDVILATHSPQLIGRWNDLVIELGDISGDDDTDENGKS